MPLLPGQSAITLRTLSPTTQNTEVVTTSPGCRDMLEGFFSGSPPPSSLPLARDAGNLTLAAWSQDYNWFFLALVREELTGQKPSYSQCDCQAPPKKKKRKKRKPGWTLTILKQDLGSASRLGVVTSVSIYCILCTVSVTSPNGQSPSLTCLVRTACPGPSDSNALCTLQHGQKPAGAASEHR